MPGAEQAPPAFMQFNGGAAFDPNQVPLPPELGAPVFNWVRRLALQADLVSADKLLRDAVADLTSSLSVVIIYAGPEGFYTLGPDGELPKDLAPVMTVGKARRALVGPHSGFVPIATSSECIAVIQLVRNVRQPAFGPAEHITMAAIARESAAVLHHLVVQHLQGKIEQAADKKSLYRPEALQYHRKKGSEGVVAELSPKWTRRAYPFLLVTMLVAAIAGILVRVPTYSSGFGIVRRASMPVTALAQGNVEALYFQRGDTVKKGDRLAKLSSPKEEGDYAQVKAERDQAQTNYLFDEQDEQSRKQVKAATTALVHAQSVLDQRYVYATADGTVSDIHTDEGKAVQPGQELMRIIKPGTKPEILAFLPSTDRPRVKQHEMKLQVGVEGFKLKRPRLAIDSISEDVVGPSDIRRMVGQEVADTLKLPNEGVSFMVVKGTFDSDKFKSGHKIYELHDGMPAKVEIEIDTKPFLAEVFPLFDRWID
ncbi:MAG: HlyD family efflux transporter periplasmic adaptor subunit [Kofleriaceae bacterium]